MKLHLDSTKPENQAYFPVLVQPRSQAELRRKPIRRRRVFAEQKLGLLK